MLFKFFYFALFFIFFTFQAYGQLRNQERKRDDSFSRSFQNLDADSEKKPRKQLIPADNSLNDSTYMVGGGDIFLISFISTPSVALTAAVDKDGNLYVPELGLIEVGQVALLEAKDKIRQHLQTLKKNESFYISLIQPKEATVTITGPIAAPGSHTLPGSMRLMDAIITANKELPSVSELDLRNVTCTNRGETKGYDLLSFLYKNKKDQNPYLYPGDEIRISPATRRVYISGPLRYPGSGMYPIKKGESLHDFLSLFVLDSSADLENIIIQRTIEGITETQTISSENVVLKNMDAVIIPTKDNYPNIHTINVGGEIASPGIYPIKEDFTTAQMILDQAGGVTPQGNIDQAVILRHGKKLPEHFNKGATSLSGIRPELGTSLAMISSTDDHLVIKLKERGLDVILEPGDQILIPKMDNFVYISGNVKNPGAVKYLPGEKCSYYIDQAGGYSRKANRSNVQVFVKYGSAVQAVETKQIEPGSIIVVPASQQYKFFSMVFLPLISALATTVGVGLAIYNSR